MDIETKKTKVGCAGILIALFVVSVSVSVGVIFSVGWGFLAFAGFCVLWAALLIVEVKSDGGDAD